MGTGSLAKRSLVLLVLFTNWLGALVTWQLCVRVFSFAFRLSDPVLTFSLVLFTLLSVLMLLHARLSQVRSSWVRLWLFAGPWCVSALVCLPSVSLFFVL